MIGSMCTAILGGILSNLVGRRRILFFTVPPIVLAWIMTGSAVNRYMVHSARLIMGIFLGMSYASVGENRFKTSDGYLTLYID